MNVRSEKYTDWLDVAGIAFRNQFPAGVGHRFTGRIRVDYIFVFDGTNKKLRHILSDIGNREKALSDFLQGKFFEDDNQIDENFKWRRIIPEGCQDHVIVRVSEIPDRRYDLPEDIF